MNLSENLETHYYSLDISKTDLTFAEIRLNGFESIRFEHLKKTLDCRDINKRNCT